MSPGNRADSGGCRSGRTPLLTARRRSDGSDSGASLTGESSSMLDRSRYVRAVSRASSCGEAAQQHDQCGMKSYRAT